MPKTKAKKPPKSRRSRALPRTQIERDTADALIVLRRSHRESVHEAVTEICRQHQDPTDPLLPLGYRRLDDGRVVDRFGTPIRGRAWKRRTKNAALIYQFDGIVALYGYGLTDEEIADALGIKRLWLKGWLRDGAAAVENNEPGIERDLFIAMNKAKAIPRMLAFGTIIQSAEEGDWRAAAKWLELNGYDRSKIQVEHSGPGGGPIQSEQRVITFALDDEARADLRRMEAEADVFLASEHRLIGSGEVLADGGGAGAGRDDVRSTDEA